MTYNDVCPVWCPYRCINAWQRGECLIRTPERTAELQAAYEAGKTPDQIRDISMGKTGASV